MDEEETKLNEPTIKIQNQIDENYFNNNYPSLNGNLGEQYFDSAKFCETYEKISANKRCCAPSQLQCHIFLARNYSRRCII